MAALVSSIVFWSCPSFPFLELCTSSKHCESSFEATKLDKSCRSWPVEGFSWEQRFGARAQCIVGVQMSHGCAGAVIETENSALNVSPDEKQKSLEDEDEAALRQKDPSNKMTHWPLSLQSIIQMFSSEDLQWERCGSIVITVASSAGDSPP
ncbi:unnamed protein product [Pleuronectes platessa]|uniref:Uncharacterized protein n=1 Tax=Pleuronectes platessa TaxID=8262 RepID=A0A9N7YS41_PLEPL|nr:unnamed protein product [Pleuronectes platessa]